MILWAKFVFQVLCKCMHVSINTYRLELVHEFFYGRILEAQNN